MARPAKPKKAADYHGALASMVQQLAEDSQFTQEVRSRLLGLLGEAMTVLRDEMAQKP